MKKKYIFSLIILGVLMGISIAFFVVENHLPDGWYYVPKTANLIAFLLCVLWSIIFVAILWRFSVILKTRMYHAVGKGCITVIFIILSCFIVLFLSWNCLLYSLKHQEKVEQYDEHVALYVNNTFVRTRWREPCYRYEENWLLMRRLTEDELNSAILKYGDPDNYYN